MPKKIGEMFILVVEMAVLICETAFRKKIGFIFFSWRLADRGIGVADFVLPGGAFRIDLPK